MTIKDIARLSGYAVGTVSRALNGHPDVSPAARARIMTVVEETGFRPNDNARHLKQRGSREVAVIVKEGGSLLFADILEEMRARIKAQGYTAAVYYLDEEENEVEQAIRIRRELKPQGVIFLGGDRESFRARFREVELPGVLVTARADTLDVPGLSSVSTDDVAAAEEAMSFLLKTGHRQIGVIGGRWGGEEAVGNTTGQLRLMGCRRACARRGVPFDPERQAVTVRCSLAGGYEGAMRLLERYPQATAILALSDVMALGALRAIRDKGLRVPEDVSLMGLDGIDQARYCVPRLTTIRQGVEQLAQRGVDILLWQVNGGNAVHETVPFRLLPGESVLTLEA